MLFLLFLLDFWYDFYFASYEFKNHFFFSRYYWPNLKSDSFENDLIEKLIQFWTKLRSRDFPKIAIKLIISRLVQVRSALGGNCRRAWPRFQIFYLKYDSDSFFYNYLIIYLLIDFFHSQHRTFAAWRGDNSRRARSVPVLIWRLWAW